MISFFIPSNKNGFYTMQKFKFIFLFLSFFYSDFCFATVNIELTEGVVGNIPVVISPFQGQGYEPTNSQNITTVIMQDFNNSGRLKAVLPADKNSTLQQSILFSQKQNIRYLVSGQVSKNASGKFDVSFMLQEIPLAESDTTSSPLSTLIKEQYTVSPSQFRTLAHYISDKIYFKLTSERGIFSTKIAYVVVQSKEGKRQFSLEVSDYDGFSPKILLSSHQPIMSPIWSPDGQKIAYVSFEKGHSQIYMSRVNDGQRQLLTSFPGINGAPAFSKDGKRLAMALTKKEAQPHIYVLNLENQALSQLTQGWAIDTEPDWAPDGQHIIFTSDRGGNPQIYKVNIATRQIERLTYDGNYNSSASYSSDGKQIALLHRSSHDYNIAILDLNNGRIFEITNSGKDESPGIAPNGSMVLYATRVGEKGILGVASLDGRVKWRLPARQGSVREPAWSPFLN